MIKNYFKIAWRNLFRNRVSAFINIGGLAAGMTVALLIGLWIWDQLSFNAYHKNHERIAQVMQNQTFAGQVHTAFNQAMQLAPELRNNYGDNFKHVVLTTWAGKHQVTYGEKKIRVRGNYMEPAVTDLLSLEMVRGSRSALNDINAVILSESTAKAIFGNTDPMNQVFRIDSRMDVKVSGIYKDLPHNSSFADLGFIAPFALVVKVDSLEKRVTWGNNWFQVLVQIADNANMEEVSAKIKDAKLKRISENEGAKAKPALFLHPMDRWHLYGEFKNGVNTGGDIEYVWMMGIIGVFVLLLACINFMNLSTARSEKRAKEVGIRKAVGSVRAQLIAQFFSESLLVTLLAFVLSIGLTQISLPFFNELSGKKIILPFDIFGFWLISIGFCFFVGLIAGSYPALYLSSFKPVKVLKGTFKTGRLAALPRKALVVVQFTISVTLIICTITVFRQLQFAMNRPIGYNSNSLVTVYLQNEEVVKHFDEVRKEILNTGLVSELATTDVPITSTYTTNSGFDWPGKDPGFQEEFLTVRSTHELGKTIGWKIKAGRDFSRSFATDSSAFILNEAAVEYMGLKNPLGTEVIWGGEEKFTVIGVVEDLVTQSPYDPPKPTIFLVNLKWTSVLNMKLTANASVAAATNKIESILKKYDTENIIEFEFADEQIARKFANEERISKLATFFTILAVFISCLGLFGLSSFVAERRSKELSVRKVLGASVAGLWRLQTKDFVWLIVISLFIAIPIAYYFMQGWLQNYQYHTALSWWIFAAAGAGALLITLLTVSFQAIKAAIANPVKALRSE
jgi:putative ABC transport system permease protein